MLPSGLAESGLPLGPTLVDPPPGPAAGRLPRTPAEDGLPPGRHGLAVLAISLGTVLTVMDGTIATVALPTIARDLHVSGSSSVLVVSVYQLMLVMVLLPCAGIADRIGARRFYQLGQAVFVCATALCFFAHSLAFLLAVRAVQALGAAAVLSVTSAMVRAVYASHRLGRGLASNSLVSSVGAAAAPTIGGLVIGVAPWPWVFAVAVPFGLLSLWLGWRALPDIPPIEAPYDLRGALLNVATLGLLMSGVESAASGGTAVVVAALLLPGAACAVWFVRHERAETRPILPLDLLGRREISLSILGSFLVFTGGILLSLSLPFRLEHRYGFTPGAVGAVLTAGPLVLIASMPVAGMLADRIDSGLQGAIGMAFTVAGLLLVAYPSAHPSVLGLACRIAPTSAGLALFVTANSRMVIRQAPRDRAAAAGGLITTTRLVGQTTGASIVAAMLGAGAGDGDAPLLAAVAASAVAGVLSLARRRARPAAGA